MSDKKKSPEKKKLTEAEKKAIARKKLAESNKAKIAALSAEVGGLKYQAKKARASKMRKKRSKSWKKKVASTNLTGLGKFAGFQKFAQKPPGFDKMV
jgi:hypothetical protein